MKEAAINTTLFDWENFEDFDVKRQFSKLSVIGTAKLPEEKIKQVSKRIEILQLLQIRDSLVSLSKRNKKINGVFSKLRQSFTEVRES